MIVTEKYYVFAQTVSGRVADVLSSMSSVQPNYVGAVDYAAEDTQFWKLQDAGSGAYAIVNKANGRFLDCDAQGHVCANPGNTHVPDSQAWYFDLLDNGLYSIRNKATQRALWARADSGDVSACTVNPTDTDQQWGLLDSSFASAVPVDVPCALASEILPGKVIAIYQEGPGLNLPAYSGDSKQRWVIRAVGDQGCYTIANQSTGEVMESDTAGNVLAKSPVSTNLPEFENQTWIFENSMTGGWGIRNKATGFYLTASSPGYISARSKSGRDEQVWFVAASYVKTDLVALGQLYSNGWNATIDTGAPCAEYVSSDSRYRTKQPTWTQNADGGGTALMQVDHIRGGGVEQDDHAYLTVTFLSTGQVYSSNLTWSLGGQWAIEWGTKVVVKIEDEVNDLASDEAGDAAAEMADVLSEGAATPFDPFISKAASDMTSKLISSLFSQLNGMIKKELYHDDGGRETYIAVINHNMNKLCASMSVIPPLALPDIGIYFSIDEFPSALLSNLNPDDNKDPVSWNGNQTTEYYVAGEETMDTKPRFSTWKQDSSAYPLKQGLYVSTKIDMIHGTLAADGHYVVMLGFRYDGMVISAQAVLIYPPDQHVPSYLSPVFTGTDPTGTDPTGTDPTATDPIQQLYQDLVSNSPYFAAPDVVKLNMLSMAQCVHATSG